MSHHLSSCFSESPSCCSCLGYIYSNIFNLNEAGRELRKEKNIYFGRRNFTVGETFFWMTVNTCVWTSFTLNWYLTTVLCFARQTGQWITPLTKEVTLKKKLCISRGSLQVLEGE